MLQRSIRFGALACLLGLSAAACGSDGGDEGAQPTTASTAKGAAAAADESDPSTWGVKDKKLVGPAGFTIDLAKCPSKWDDKAGLTDSEIRLGQTLPQSGALAAYGGIGQGMKAIFDHVNATEGGIAGRKINLVQKDDGYEAARGKANVDEMLETGNPFAIASSVGTPIVMATYEKIDESCVPDLFAGSGHPRGATR
ncbi:MAG: ABC transporter substrate-binding protein [Acidimicrobiales bacterium]